MSSMDFHGRPPRDWSRRVLAYMIDLPSISDKSYGLRKICGICKEG